MFEYRKWNRYFAQIAGGMEETGAEELTELGAKNIKQAYRGLYFKADQKTLYMINYKSRLITRVLAPLLTFQCHSTKYLYKTAVTIKWDELFKPDNTFAIFATVSHSKISHSKYAALCLKDAIADYFREKYGERPNVDTREPDVWINLHIENDKAVISLDTSGGSLHRRGYRVESVDAPMQETVAAAVIRFSKWNGEQPFYDPMCGSGTLICEALMHYCRIPAGFLRKKFGFEILPDFNRKLWNSVKKNNDDQIRSLPKELIMGSDMSSRAISITQTNLKKLTFGDTIKVAVKDFREITNIKQATIICNPPYGIRLGNEDEIRRLYRAFGTFLKQNCKGSTAYLFLGSLDQIKNIGLKPTFKKPMVNGAIKGRLCKFEIYT